MSIADNVARIRERIAAAAARAGRRADEITLVAVSKTFPAESLAASAKVLGAAGAGHPTGPPRLPILLEVRLAPEETKHGVEPADLPAVVEAVRALPHLDLRGLMCIPPFCANPEDARPYFRRLRELRDDVATKGAQPFDFAQGEQAAPLRELSMGMSHDFEVAIEEGATQVRLGTAIFGVRELQ